MCQAGFLEHCTVQKYFVVPFVPKYFRKIWTYTIMLCVTMGSQVKVEEVNYDVDCFGEKVIL